LHDPPEQFEDHEAQSVFWELRKFLLLALKANPNILETLHSPEMEILDEIGEELVSMRSVFLSKLIFQTFSGYAMSQFKKMEQDLRNHGEVRWKHAMHLLRLLISGRQTLETGLLNISMVEHREFLLSVKRGELKWEEVADRRKELHREFEQAFAKSELPERPDSSRVNAFLVSARKRAFMRMRKIME